MEEQFYWACAGCNYLIFDIAHPDLKVISQTAKRALVEWERRAHALRRMSWSQIEKRLSLLNQTQALTQHNLYVRALMANANALKGGEQTR